MNLSGLNYPDKNSIVTKHISYSHNLFFDDHLLNKNIKIDEVLYIINGAGNKKAKRFLEKFIQQETKWNQIQGSYILYKYSNKKRGYFEAEDCIMIFLTAIRVYKNTECNSNIHFSIKDSRKNEYYLPFHLKGSLRSNARNRTIISSRKELNKIKKIYFNLKKIKFEDYFNYSRLHNSVNFLNHAYNENWTLLKTTLLFISLESLFNGGGSELTYKIALRTSYFLYPKNSLERKKVFEFLKKGYKIRSKFVHGTASEKEINKVMQQYATKKGISYYDFHHDFIEELQEIVASCLRSILLDEKYLILFTNAKSEEIDDFLDDLIVQK